ncbi:MAG: FtsH protease activity modulator HflK [Roseburia sp.]|nr:FtsH protease activity modulator HflK [Ruminococcus sp.]MCM1154602.1 FtsH protease activity modulator HflK [Roseburia sp.]MCM1241687.1 FtsH protease activity modulator HflK [Roseburia sp.]
MFTTRQKGPEINKAPSMNKGRASLAAKIVIAVIVLLFLAGNSYYTIQEEEQAVVCTFGSPRAVTMPGLHFKIPFIQTVTKVNTTIQGFTIGYTLESENMTATDDTMMITSDYNFINVDFYAAYRVTDPVKALYASEDPVEILKNIAQNCIRTTIGSYTVDSVLTTGKNEIQANITQMILEKLESYDIGLQLVNITIQDAEPPTEEVSNAFKEVETAKQGKETALNNANKYRNEQIPNAEAKSDEILQNAEAAKQERINEANGQVARFNSMYAEYIKYPEVTKKRMFYEAMENILPGVKVVIQSSDGTTSTVLPLDSFVTDEASSVNDNGTDSNNNNRSNAGEDGEEE